MIENNALNIWTVYKSPDFPDKYVARLWKSWPGGPPEGKATDNTIVADDLEDIRRHMVMLGLTCLTRHPSDDPVIVETWSFRLTVKFAAGHKVGNEQWQTENIVSGR
jgi:hypothetical protein